MLLLRPAILAVLVLSSVDASAGWPDGVIAFVVDKGETVQVGGAFETGKVLEDLSWAWDSSVACFPGTQSAKYRGRHVFFATQIPPHSDMTITVIPADPKQDVSLYAYELGTTRFSLPPSVPSAVSCEASHKWDRPHEGKAQDHTRSVRLNAVQHPYNVLIGVTGPASTVQGRFTLEVTTR